MMRQSAKYIQGRRGEIIACAVLADEGWGAVPTAELGGPLANRAPLQLQLQSQNIVLADFDISKLGRPRLWLEAKTKGHFFMWRKTRRKQTGIEARLLPHYLRLQDLTGAPVVICMIDIETGDVLAAPLRALGEPRFSTDDAYPIANWDRERFVRLRTVNPRRLKNLLEHHTLPPPVTRKVLQQTLNYLRPQYGDQGELRLFHSDVVAEWARRQRQPETVLH
jgi:hypothetical protein